MLGNSPFRYVDVVGRWRLRVTNELLAFISRGVSESVPDAEARDEALAEAVHEAAGAEIELCDDGTFVSRSHGIELLRAQISVPGGLFQELTFEKAPGAPVRVRLSTPHSLSVWQPGRPEMLFDRVADGLTLQ